jgi:hypothetical protein
MRISPFDHILACDRFKWVRGVTRQQLWRIIANRCESSGT